MDKCHVLWKSYREVLGFNMALNRAPAVKVRTTLSIDKNLKKLAQIYALQNDLDLQDVIEVALSEFLTKK